MHVPLKLTALIFTFLITSAGMVYAFLFRDTTIVVVGLGIVGGVIGANAVCDYHDRSGVNGNGQR